MTLKQQIIKDLDTLEEQQLKKVQSLIKGIKTKPAKSTDTLFGKVKKIKISGPKDFAKSFDSYISGEKSL